MLTVVDVTNAFFLDPVYGFGPGPLFYTSGTLVTGVSGTMTIDCADATSAPVAIHGCEFGGTYDLSFLPNNRGDGSYLFPFGGGIAQVVFAANGLSSSLFNDRAYNYLYAPDVHQIPMSWTAARVPDRASSFMSVLIGIVGLASIKSLFA